MGEQTQEPGSAETSLIVRISRGGSGTDSSVPSADGWDRRRTAIVEAATTLFLQHGYQDTSTAQIATAASTSKQTIYNHFGGKERLFRAIIIGLTATAEPFVKLLPETFAEITNAEQLEPALNALARRYLTMLTDPQLLALRRLIIGEAHRFPDLAREYFQRAPALTIGALAAGCADLTHRGILHTPDPDIAAEHFASLVVGRSLDRGMFTIDTDGLTSDRIKQISTPAVHVFLAAYGRPA